MSLKEFEMELTRLLATEDTYQLDSFALEEGQVYHASYRPKEPGLARSEFVHLFLRATASEKLTAVFCTNQSCFIKVPLSPCSSM